MALIIPGPMAAVIRGSIGGTTFSKNSAGAYARNRSKPTWPGTDAQNEVTGYMSTIVDTWQGLAVAVRNAWEAKRSSNELRNKVGQNMVPSGFNLYARANLNLLLTTQAMVTVPPTPMVIDTPRFWLDWTDGQGIRVTNVFGWAPAYTDRIMFQWLTKQRQSIVFHKGPYEERNSIAGTGLRDVPTTLLLDTALLSDTRTFCRFKVVVETGAVSAAWTTHVDVGTIS